MNKKVIALLTAAVLFTGAGSFGTYAYFTSHYELSEKVDIKMGSVNVIANWKQGNNEKWVIEEVNKEGKLNDNGETLSASNLKHGSKLQKTVEIKNNGTLIADVAVKVQNINNIKVGIKENGSNQFNINGMKPGEVKELTLELTVTGKPNDKVQNIANGSINNFVTVDATQLK